MHEILVVFTGGTIGSKAAGGTIDTESESRFKLLELFEKQFAAGRTIRFDSIAPVNLLSENLAPAVWPRIIRAIEDKDPNRYDGIIVTHGTDTLAYTSAALGFYFHAWKTPILMVSSDYPLDDPRANGPANFACAVEFILNIGDPGIYVPYRNRHRPMQVHRGTRLASSLQLSGDFISVQNRSYMQFDNGRFERLDADVAEPLSSFPWLEPVFSERVMMIRPYPGLDYSRIDTAGVDAVLHDLYHSGTACATAQWGDQYSLVAFIEHCSEQGVTVYLAPAFKSESAYQSTRALLAAGAEMIWNMSLEASYAKLLLAYGNYRNDAGVAALLEADIAFEHLR